MKTSPEEKACNYSRHTANDPFVKAETGKYFITEGDTIRILEGDIRIGGRKGSYHEVVALTCLACGERWYTLVKQ